MHVTIPDSLKEFIEEQVSSGRYPDPDAFVSDLVRTEAEMFKQIGAGEALPVDQHFGRRLEALLDEAEQSGDHLDVTREDCDAVEREALDLLRDSKSS